MQGRDLSDGTHSDYDDYDDFDIAPGKDDISLMSSDDDGSIELGYDNDTALAINADTKERKSRSNSFDSSSNHKRKHEKIVKLSDSAKLLAKEKNREHAKNTRMRKKSYIESLKETVQQLSDEREKIERDRNIAINKLVEQAKTRKKVLQELLHYRAKHVLDRRSWSTILEDNVVFVLPVTPYRSFPAFQICQGQRYLNGIDAIVADITSHSVLYQSIAPNHHLIDFEFTYNNQDCTIIEDTLMCKWELTTTNAMKHGCKMEISLRGMLKAIFSPHNRLVCVEMIYDVMSYMQQLRRAAGKRDFAIIPNTLSLAEETGNSFHKEVRIIFEPTAPYTVYSINEEFSRLYGYNPEELISHKKSFYDILHGNLVSQNKPSSSSSSSSSSHHHSAHDMNEIIEEITTSLKNGWCYSTIMPIAVNPMINTFTEGTESEKNSISTWIRFFPLYSDTSIAQYLAILEPHLLSPTPHTTHHHHTSHHTSSHHHTSHHTHAHFHDSNSNRTTSSHDRSTSGSSSSSGNSSGGSSSGDSSGYTTHASSTPTTTTTTHTNSHTNGHTNGNINGMGTTHTNGNTSNTRHRIPSPLPQDRMMSSSSSSRSTTTSSSSSNTSLFTSSSSSSATSSGSSSSSGGGGSTLSSMAGRIAGVAIGTSTGTSATTSGTSGGGHTSGQGMSQPQPPSLLPPPSSTSTTTTHHTHHHSMLYTSPTPSNLTNRLYRPPATTTIPSSTSSTRYPPMMTTEYLHTVAADRSDHRMVMTDSPPEGGSSSSSSSSSSGSSTTSSNKSAQMLQEILQIVGQGSSGDTSGGDTSGGSSGDPTSEENSQEDDEHDEEREEEV